MCFLVPGTPKDLLTYVAGIGSSPLWRIVAITTVGRIPSIALSTLASSLAARGDWKVAGIVMAVIVVLVLSGAALYFFLRRKGKLG